MTIEPSTGHVQVKKKKMKKIYIYNNNIIINNNNNNFKKVERCLACMGQFIDMFFATNVHSYIMLCEWIWFVSCYFLLSLVQASNISARLSRYIRRTVKGSYRALGTK